MQASDLAAMLHEREMGSEITDAEESQAKENRLLVVFGCSDDNAELRGIVKDEVGCDDGGEFRVDAEGVRRPWEADEPIDEDDARAFFERERLPSVSITAIWCDDVHGPCWRYETDSDDVARFSILEDGEPWCEGVVIDCKHLFTKETE